MSTQVMDVCPRVEPPPVADEATLALAFLDYQRETIICKVGGLSAADGWRTLPPTNMSLLGLMKHLTIVEQIWFRIRFAGAPGTSMGADFDWDACWTPDPAETPADILARYQAEVANSRALVAGRGFDDLATNPPPHLGDALTLRWIVLHMIEEVARHNGHADLLRQAIDGEVGE